MDKQPGLGELLRHLTDLVDSGALRVYCAMDLADFKPRYTPVIRALAAGATTVTAITRISHLTQGAISQTVALMQADGLVEKYPLPDARQSGLRLTRTGQRLLQRLQPHWQTTFDAIARLEADIGHPLRAILADAIAALQDQDFAQRLQQVSERTTTNKADPA